MLTRLALMPIALCAVLAAGCDKHGNFAPDLDGIPVDRVVSVTVQPQSASVVVGDSVQLTATVTVVGNEGKGVFWSSSDTKIATVDSNGKVTTLAPGLVMITAISVADSGARNTSAITVFAPVTTISGTFDINATKVTDTGCNFSPSFTGQIQVSGNSDGSNVTMRLIERLTRIYNGSVKSDGTFNATGSGNLDGFQYTGTLIGQATPSTVQGTETLNFNSGCPGKQVVYQFTGIVR